MLEMFWKFVKRQVCPKRGRVADGRNKTIGSLWRAKQSRFHASVELGMKIVDIYVGKTFCKHFSDSRLLNRWPVFPTNKLSSVFTYCVVS